MPRRAAGEAIERMVRTADFERVLRARTGARTPHFAMHHLPAIPAGAAPSSGPLSLKLSTSVSEKSECPVEDFSSPPPPGVSTAPIRLGAVVPKRHARRAVTRSLLKRQIYAAARRHAGDLPHGWWVVRLRAPFDRAVFSSAASPALRRLARAELDALFVAARPLTA